MTKPGHTIEVFLTKEGGSGVIVTTAQDSKSISFKQGEAFAFLFSDSRRMSDGKTFGDAIAAELHKELDAWIKGEKCAQSF